MGCTSIALSCDIQVPALVLWELVKPALQELQIVPGFRQIRKVLALEIESPWKTILQVKSVYKEKLRYNFASMEVTPVMLSPTPP
jgi:ABC-type long-subunit fatty acid transport system fused permease/ATPase subunit